MCHVAYLRAQTPDSGDCITLKRRLIGLIANTAWRLRRGFQLPLIPTTLVQSHVMQVIVTSGLYHRLVLKKGRVTTALHPTFVRRINGKREKKKKREPLSRCKNLIRCLRWKSEIFRRAFESIWIATFERMLTHVFVITTSMHLDELRVEENCSLKFR